MTETPATISELLADAESIELLDTTDGKSGVRMERVTIDGESFVVKYLSLAEDWIMRLTGDRAIRPLQVWESSIRDRVPACIDDAVVAIGLDDPDDDRSSARLAILMRDVGAWLVPEGDEPISLEQHRTFLAHMAALHAAFWEWTDDVGLYPTGDRYVWFAPDRLVSELSRPDCVLPVRLADDGWRELARREPDLWATIVGIHRDPSAFVRTLANTPFTFLHGDWKMGNLGTAPDGRTVLIDWAVPGCGPACSDLTHYLALNRSRLPESKERTIDAYRASLERCGVDTEPWWQQQLDLCLLGGSVQFGWEKALGDSREVRDELAWWVDRGAEGRRWLS